MNSKTYTAILALCMGGLCAMLFGQEAPIKEAAPNSSEFSFTCLYWDNLPEEQLYYRQGEAYHELQFRKAIRSDELKIQGMSTFELFRAAATPVEGKPPYELLGKTAIPKSRKVLFVVIPFKDHDITRYRVVAMDDSQDAFPPGSFRFVNFTQTSLLLKCGETQATLPAQKLSVIRPKGYPEGGFVPFAIGNTAGKTLFGTRIYGQPTGRELVFISPPAKKGAMPRVKFVSQLVAPPAPVEN